MKKIPYDTEVVVIGAGLAGVLATLKISKKRKVLLIEQGDEIIPKNSSSFNESYRIHTGLHYLGNLETAIKCLISSVAFAREFSDYILGGEDTKSYLRRGRYYIMSNSLFSSKQALYVASELRKKYQELISLDIKNKVFGEAEDFFKLLNEEDYAYIAQKIPFYPLNEEKEEDIKVELGIETSESQIDIDKLKKYLSNAVNENENIIFLTNTEVTHIAHLPNSLGYSILTKNKLEICTSAVVNCSWQNIEKLDKKLGYYIPDEHRVNRIKISLHVKLPHNLKEINTGLFSAGPYCSITNLGDGTAILTSEKTTNAGYYKAGDEIFSQELQKLLNNKLNVNKGKGKYLVDQIIKECADYIPDLKNALPLDLRLGYVKLIHTTQPYNKSSLYKNKSPIHIRDEDGIEIKGLGFISGSSMKMIYAAVNADKIDELLDQHFEVAKTIKNILQLVEKNLEHFLEKNKNYRPLIKSLLYCVYDTVILSKMKKLELLHSKHQYAQLLTFEIQKILGLKKSLHLEITKFKHSSLFKPPAKKNQKKSTLLLPIPFRKSKL